MIEAYQNFIEGTCIQKVSDFVCSGISSAYTMVKEGTWAIYTTSMLVSVLVALASSHEKQIMADHLYGSDATLQQQQERSNIIESGRKHLLEEASQGVKQMVWIMPREEFLREYHERHGK
uniref:Archaic Translocase of outer membrane 14 kDa subunit n=1 Tax=Trypanosoma congolense (strain IL3000) TaxID=1068625 RepID=G0V0K3_TRYCI|nr:conserved hypothetical protein [Trypanosoma congolense IL3000]